MIHEHRFFPKGTCPHISNIFLHTNRSIDINLRFEIAVYIHYSMQKTCSAHENNFSTTEI